MVAVVDIDLNKLALSGKTVRLNVSIPERTVALIDRAARGPHGTTRSNGARRWPRLRVGWRHADRITRITRKRRSGCHLDWHAIADGNHIHES